MSSLCCFLLSLLVIRNASCNWNKEFVTSSKTIPSIEIKLAPPENPLPQVEDEVHSLESKRIQLEEGMMAKVEEKFNEAILDSKTKIKDLIQTNLKIFDNEGLVLSLLSRNRNVSFLQTGQNVIPSSVRVMMANVQLPDPIIKEKMDQIEQVRSDEEIQTFYQISDEFDQLVDVTMIELDMALKMQLNPYLPETSEIKELIKYRTAKNRKNVSFLQLAQNPLNLQQLNVKIGQSDIPYPTVDDYVIDMEKRRDVAERVGRSKVLSLFMKLIKAQHEMIRDELHVQISRIISQYSDFIEEYHRKPK